MKTLLLFALGLSFSIETHAILPEVDLTVIPGPIDEASVETNAEENVPAVHMPSKYSIGTLAQKNGQVFLTYPSKVNGLEELLVSNPKDVGDEAIGKQVVYSTSPKNPLGEDTVTLTALSILSPNYELPLMWCASEAHADAHGSNAVSFFFKIIETKFHPNENIQMSKSEGRLEVMVYRHAVGTSGRDRFSAKNLFLHKSFEYKGFLDLSGVLATVVRAKPAADGLSVRLIRGDQNWNFDLWDKDHNEIVSGSRNSNMYCIGTRGR